MQHFDAHSIRFVEDDIDTPEPTGRWRDHGRAECRRLDCAKVFRVEDGCPLHGRKAQAEDCLRSLELERRLTITLAGGTTDAKVLARIDSLERRAAILRGYLARMVRR